jgi:hypothetical protein
LLWDETLPESVLPRWKKWKESLQNLVILRPLAPHRIHISKIWLTATNPADLGSRSGDIVVNQLWKEGPDWLSEPANWPEDVTLVPDEHIKAEEKVTVKN